MEEIMSQNTVEPRPLLDRRRFLKVLGAAGVLAGSSTLLSACGSGGSSSPSSSAAASGSSASSGAAAAPATSTPTKIIVGASTTGPGAGLLVVAGAAKTGEEFGLELELSPVDNAPNMIAALQSKKVDIAGYSAPAPLSYIADGNTDLTIVGGLMSDYESLIVLPDNTGKWKGEITAELIDGLQLGSNRTNSGDIAFRGWLAENGFDISKITFTEFDTPATVIEAVKNGAVDAGIINGAYYLPAEAQGLVNVRFIRDIIGKDFICCRQLIRTEQADDIELWTKVEKAMIRAWQLYKTDQQATLDALSTFIVSDIDAIKYQVYDYGDLIWNPDPGLKSVKEYWEGMQASGYIAKESPIKIEDFVQIAPYKRALDELTAEDPDDPLLKELNDSWNKLDVV
jgi:NitT/TauT family transport system substrate-binding protein